MEAASSFADAAWSLVCTAPLERERSTLRAVRDVLGNIGEGKDEPKRSRSDEPAWLATADAETCPDPNSLDASAFRKPARADSDHYDLDAGEALFSDDAAEPSWLAEAHTETSPRLAAGSFGAVRRVDSDHYDADAGDEPFGDW